jgi:hypothetical protein
MKYDLKFMKLIMFRPFFCIPLKAIASPIALITFPE